MRVGVCLRCFLLVLLMMCASPAVLFAQEPIQCIVDQSPVVEAVQTLTAQSVANTDVLRSDLLLMEAAYLAAMASNTGAITGTVELESDDLITGLGSVESAILVQATAQAEFAASILEQSTQVGIESAYASDVVTDTLGVLALGQRASVDQLHIGVMLLALLAALSLAGFVVLVAK